LISSNSLGKKVTIKHFSDSHALIVQFAHRILILYLEDRLEKTILPLFKKIIVLPV
jgi:hypothetical protein